MKKFFAIYIVSVIAVMVGITSARAATIALWTFEDGVPGTPAGVVQDVVGGNDGIANGAPLYTAGVRSTFGSTGLNFNGIDQSVFIDSTSGGPLELSGDFTIELGLVSGNSLGDGIALFMGDPTPGQDPYYIFVQSNGDVTFHLYTGAANFNLSAGAGTVTANSSHTIGAVFDFDDINGTDNFMRLFIDQEEVASLNIGNQVPFYGDTNSDLWFGSVHDTGLFYQGTVSDVRISDIALTGDQMMAIPEPGILAVFGIGLLGLGLCRRGRRAC